MSLQREKADAKLGEKVREHLQALGIDTPMQSGYHERMAHDARSELETMHLEIESSFKHIMERLGLNLTDDSLVETPKRVAKMFLREIFWGLDWNNFPKVTVVQNKMKYDEMVIERNITVNSTCEHHFLPILGHAHIGYIPKDKVPGLSKLNRVVEFFARRPQIQERLTEQIHATLCHILETDNVAVVIDAEHLCVRTRGVEDPCSDTVTSKLSGAFRKDAVRAEFMSLIVAKRAAF